ncbi:methionine--tRNA ligase-like protein [Galdieria sulphuraria]|uniref:Methionine--tRNA ligase-like protein n=1 Tax=Galdieria sulphuraria TaxID=130081 RepID=M2XLD7_GALSU|nr:methionine--tRNA ligase-like protein [Galdieria sulphuraria]EME30982.1 methionine--tRNA ligase-like protein [Galdieria sulphuraria]|eukprot:XP_005707502.1 methionine--tRNA ligase-like protein [Galdieria sulphuraria]
MTSDSRLQGVLDFCSLHLSNTRNKAHKEFLWKELTSCNIVSDHDPLLGSGDSRAVQYWFEQAGEQDKNHLLQSVNKHLSNKTYLVGERLTVADIAMYVSLYSLFEQKWSESQRLLFADALRWFDLLQNSLPIGQKWEKIDIDFTVSEEKLHQLLDNKLRIETEKPKEEAVVAHKKNKDKLEKAKSATNTKGGSEEKNDEPLKEEAEEDVSRLDIRVGKILSAKRHPDADTLYIEEIDVGEASPRTVCSGLVKFIPDPEQLLGYCIVLCNLKPVNMRGVKSEAMILCATSKDGTTVELVKPPEDVPTGERVTFPGHDGVADSVLNPKKKIFEKVQPYFATNEECIAVWKDIPFTTSQGPCKVASIRGGTIR